MKLAILQPVLIPDLQDLAAMFTADKIVIQDNEQWSRKGRTHRALIRTPGGTQYLNVPVRTADRKKAINKVRIDHSRDWIDPVLRSLRYNYSNSVYYDFYEPEIRSDLLEAKKYEYLIEFSSYLKNRILQFMGVEIDAETVWASELESYSSDPDKLAENLGAAIYYQEHDARHYQRQGKNKHELLFNHPQYRQHFEGFESGCCLLDLLFQYGPESFRVLDKL